MTFSISNREIVISTEVETASISIAQKDYYLNNPYDRVLSKVTYESAGKLYSRFTLDDIANTNVNIATMSSFDDFRGSVEPSTYTSVSNGDFWFSSMYKDDTPTLFYRDSGLWKSTYNSNKNFDSQNGTFINLDSIELVKSNWLTTNVSVATEQKAIDCNNGATYAGDANRCEAYTSNACDTANGMIWNSTRSRCEKQPTCNSGDTLVGLNCRHTTITSATSSTSTVFDGFTIKYWWKAGGSDSSWWSYQGTVSQTDYIYSSKNGWGDVFIIYSDGRIKKIPMATGSDSGGTLYTYLATFVDYTNQIDSTIEAWDSKYQIYTDGTIKKWNTTTGSDSGGSVYYVGTVDATGYIENNSFPTKKRYTISKNTSTVTTYTCLTGYVKTGTTCYKYTYYTPICSIGSLDGTNGVCYEASTCSGKKMPVSPYYSTPYNGNNGVCYSDAGLYCKNTGVSWDGVYTCFDHSEHCDDATWNLRYDTDLCEKFNFSCSDTTYNRYGLATSPTNNDATDLYNRIASKDDKLNAVASAILSGDLDVNDNNGAMCTKLNYSTFTQPSPALDYTINSEIKSGF
jgi:hypothetical protein